MKVYFLYNILGLLKKNPNDRMNIKEVLEHPFIQINCECPIQSSKCKVIVKNNKRRIKEIPNGEIFKLYSSPHLKFLCLGNEKIEKYFVFDDDKIHNIRKKNSFINVPKICKNNLISYE